MAQYEVCVANTFEADSFEEAVAMMIDWLSDSDTVSGTTYRVNLVGNSWIEYIAGAEI